MVYKPSLAQLPPEITSEIFTAVQSSRTELPLEFIPSIRLTQVCRRWREIALNDPSLWTTLRLKGTGLPLEYEADGINEYLVDEGDALILTETLLLRDCNALSLFLTRSRNLPLTLWIEHGYPYGESVEHTEYGRILRETLAPSLHKFISRCEYVHLGAPGDSMPWEGMHPLVMSALDQAEHLRELSSGYAWIGYRGRSLCEAVFSRLKVLKTFDSAALDSIRDIVKPSSLQTLDVSFDGMEWDIILAAIRCCPQLQRLSAAVVLPAGEDEATMALLPHLCHLTLGVEPSTSAGQTPLQMLQYLQAPVLASLQIEWDYAPSEACAPSLTELLERTRSVIDLNLHGATFSEEELMSILKSAPNVKTLRFHVHDLPKSGVHPLISLLSIRDTGGASRRPCPSFCPAMESFTFTTQRKGNGNSATMDSIISFLAARTGITESDDNVSDVHEFAKGPAEGDSAHLDQTPLRHVTFEVGVPPEVTLPYVGIYDSFVRRGMEVSIELK